MRVAVQPNPPDVAVQSLGAQFLPGMVIRTPQAAHYRAGDEVRDRLNALIAQIGAAMPSVYFLVDVEEAEEEGAPELILQVLDDRPALARRRELSQITPAIHPGILVVV